MSFSDFNVNGPRHNELDSRIRIFGPNASVAQDLEPEYIAVSEDGATAWVTLQENNALATIDIPSASVTRLVSLGFKDHSLVGNGFDASDKDDKIMIAPRPVMGMYMPDGIAAHTVGGATYLLTRQVRQSFAPRQLAWLLRHPSERLSAAEKAVLNDLINRNSAIGTARNLAQGFRQLFRDKQPEQLAAWFEAVRESGLDDLQTFAVSLKREQTALTAAILLPWSNGPTEGVVTKLKLIKRSMYGRGSFDLLRKRVLLAA